MPFTSLVLNGTRFVLLVAVILFAHALEAFGGGADGQAWDPFRLRVQLTAEAAVQFQSNGELPDGLFVGQSHSGLPQLDRLNSRHQAVQVRRVFTSRPEFEARHREFGLDRWIEIEFAQPRSILSLQSEYLAADEVVWAEPVYHVMTFDEASFPNDPRFAEQWALRNTGQGGGTQGADISMEAAWELATGDPSVVVLVVDSGIATTHPDLLGSLWVNPNPGLENGYDGDLHGWNFVSGNNNLSDSSGHGTQVAGIIGASSNNDTGIAGVAGGSGTNDGVRLMIARTFNATGSGGFAEALVYGADNGAVIASNSWGYTVPDVFEAVVLDAIDYFIANAGMDAEGEPVGPIQGGVVVFAAGNSGTEERFYPAAYSPVIAVASTDRNDLKANSSTYGEWIDLSAPGQSILTTHRNGNYITVSGTSFACPHVSGVAALLASRFPGMTNSQLVDRLLSTTDAIDDVNSGFAGLLGSGRLNAAQALLEDPAAPPSAITDLSVVAVGQESVDLEWTAPGASGHVGQAASYELRFATEPLDADNFATGILVEDVIAPATAGISESFSVTGLAAATEYWFAIRSQDFFGNVSELSNGVTATTWALPEAALAPTSIEEDLQTGDSLVCELTLSNNGAGPLVYQALSETLPGWLSLTPVSGVVAGGEEQVLELTIDASGLANGFYEVTLTIQTNDPLAAELTVELSITITGGVAAMAVAPSSLDFGDVYVGISESRSVTISNPGTDVLTVTTIDLEGDGFSIMDAAPISIAAGDSVSLEVTIAPDVAGAYSGSLTLVGDVPESEPLVVSLSANALLPPIAAIDPLSIERTLAFDAVETLTLIIANEGGEDLTYSVRLLPLAPPEGEAQPLLTLNPLAETLPLDEGLDNRLQPVDLVMDDGTSEDAIGLTNGGEFIWLNQFTPASADYPFVLTQAAVYFPSGADIAVGKKFDLYVYASESGVADAEINLLQRVEAAVVSVVDDWTSIALPAPIYLTEASDIWIGVVNREVGRNGFPAAIDFSSGSQQRSWVGVYNGSVPNEPSFPADDLWGIADDFGLAGNWLIRGYGHRDFVRLDSQTGVVASGDAQGLTLTIEPKDLLAGSYYYLLEFETNDPLQPVIGVPLTVTVTGEPVITVMPESLDFAAMQVDTEKDLSLQVRNEGIAPLTVTAMSFSDPAFSVDLESFTLEPGRQQRLTITCSPNEIGELSAQLTLFSNDPVSPEKVIPLNAEVLPPPEIRIDPQSLSVELTRLESKTLTATLFNDGLGPLHYSLSRVLDEASGEVITLPIQDAALPSIDFILDDGSVEDSLGLIDGMQFLWANQFTPEAGDSPLFLERVEVLFDSWTGAMVGDPLDLHIYQVLEGDAADGAVLIHSMLAESVQTLEDWSVYALEEPLLLEHDGDVLVAVVFRAPLFEGWPATIDTSSPSQGRSWIGLYFGDPPAIPELPAADYWGLVDDLGFAGNWMIRAHGTRAFGSLEPTSGVIPAGESVPLAIDVSGVGLSVGNYLLDFLFVSNDPVTPELTLPLAISVTGAQALSISPATIDFGTVREDVSVDSELVLSNTGADPLTVSSLTLDNADIQLSGFATPMVIAPGEAVVGTLTLQPSAIGVLTAELVVVSDDPKQAVQALAIQADIVAAPDLDWDPVVPAVINNEAGGAGDLRFDVSNSGGAPLHYHIRAAAALGGPDSFGYRWRCNAVESTMPYHWLDARIEGTELTDLAGTPDGNQAVTLPFDFPFYGEQVSIARVSVNGWLTFGGFTGGGWTPRALPDASEPTHIIAPFWDDLSLLDGGSVHVLHVEEADNEHWIIQWSEARRMSNPDSELTFQVALWPSGLIEFRYHTMHNSGASSSIGIADAGGERGLQVAFASAFAEAGKVVRILAETPLVADLPLTGTIAPGESVELSIPYDASGLFAGTYLQDLVLSFDDPDLTALWLPLKWTLSGEPQIDVSSTLVDFGVVAVGDEATQTLTVANTGTDILTLSGADFSSERFSLLTNLPLTIAPGTELDLTMRFNPLLEGDYSASVIFNSNAVNHPQRTVFLRGSSVYEASVPVGYRTLPDWYMPGQALSAIDPLAVQLQIVPDSNTAAYAVEDLPPEGWIVDPDSISDGGSIDPMNGKVKFGPFFDNQPRTLTYDVTAPLSASGEAVFTGVVAVDGLSRPLEGDVSTFFDIRHPADGGSEFIITASDVTAYGAAWKNHLDWPRPPAVIPMSYVTRAGALWRQGEMYQYDPTAGEAPLWWVSAVASEPLAGMLGLTSASAIATGPDYYYPGEPLHFNVVVEPQNGVLSYAVEEQVPEGWQVLSDSISHGGSFHAPSGTLRFGPFLDNQARTLSFTLLPPEDARGSVQLTGSLSYNGLITTTQGQRQLNAPPVSFLEWTQRVGLVSSSAQPEADPEGVGVSNLLRYALAMDFEGVDRDRLPQMRIFADDQGQLQRPGLSFLLSTSADDIQLSVEASSDLIHWTPLADSAVDWQMGPPNGGVRQVEVRDLEATPDNPPRRFYRLKVKLIEP